MKKLLVQFILKAKFETYLTVRAAVGLNLKNSIVIVDEAHNLLETITNIHRLPSSSFGKKKLVSNAVDPDPCDTYVFGPSGSGSVIISGSGSFNHQAKRVKKT